MVLRRSSDVLKVSEHLLVGSPGCCGRIAAIFVEGVILGGCIEALRRGVDRQGKLALVHFVLGFGRHLGSLRYLCNALQEGDLRARQSFNECFIYTLGRLSCEGTGKSHDSDRHGQLPICTHFLSPRWAYLVSLTWFRL